MTPARFTLALAVLALGCNSQPAAQASQAAQPANIPSRPPSSPEERLNAWIPNHGAAQGGAPQGASPHGGSPHGDQAPPSAPLGEFGGTVRETMNAAGYTYMRIDVSGTDRWVATTQMPVAVNDRVVVAGGNVMGNFHSRTLDRTFPEIVFASTVRVNGAQAAAPTPAPAVAPTPAPAVAPSPAVPSTPPPGARHGIVRETMNSGNYTYLRVEGVGSNTWVAVPQTTLAVGDEVDVAPGSEMPGFHSNTLNRTFEQITFSSGVTVVRSAGRPAAPVHAPPPPNHP
ncbi:MAG: hypothetical protein U0326_15565 [Polyangiales bacterium]